MMDKNRQYNITLNAYDGDLTLIRDLSRLVENSYSDVFHSVIVHGSIATKEVIPYSDFDGLLIVKDRFMASSRLQKFKNESMKLILNFDPLQHHGWFQIKESDFDDYPESYLPVSTLEHSKLIYPNVNGLHLDLKISNNSNYKRSLEGILNQFDKRLQNNWKPANIYELKSILSQVMLIPCLYYSAIYNKGIFKRESFEAVKSEFTEEEWEPIKIASQLRENWTNELTSFQEFLLQLSNPILRKIVKKYGAPKISAQTQNLLNNGFYSNLNSLIQKIKLDIQ